MREEEGHIESLLAALHERAKELNCLYDVEKLLTQRDLSLTEVFEGIVEALRPGFQHTDVCHAEIIHEGTCYGSCDLGVTPWRMSRDLTLNDEVVGRISVFYTEERPEEDVGPFLQEEERLIQTIADRLAHFLLFRELRAMRRAEKKVTASDRSTWRGPIELLRKTDQTLYERISRKMLNQLCWMGVEEAQRLVRAGGLDDADLGPVDGEVNVPRRRRRIDRALLASDVPFELASSSMSNEEIVEYVQRWVQEDRAGAFLRVLENVHAPQEEVADALRRFHQVHEAGGALSDSTMAGARVGLIRRFLAEQPEYIVAAKEHLDTRDFEHLLEHLVPSGECHGKLGGKGAGLFLAHRILQKVAEDTEGIGEVRTPKTWYLPSDGLAQFVHHNDLEEVIEQKYKAIEEVRRDYENVVQLFKSCAFPRSMVKALKVALEDFGDVPLIVRSSSLLEDRLGTAFSGKYKSLFLPNQGSKNERLSALFDAIAEIYASTFGPDPIEYQRARGLLDFHEEMGLLIQEVVGQRVGKYYLPAFAGVAFSNNEFRWSPRIRREDGLLRIVPGLGTRAVDRTTDDYPVLCAPGQPNLRVNTTVDETLRYSPARADAINLETREFVTVELKDLLKEVGTDYPGFPLVFSKFTGDRLVPVSPLLTDPERDDLVATFDGLLARGEFVKRMGNILDVLETRLGAPVDIEFAHDGEAFYLLQCRPQANSAGNVAAPIPQDVAQEDIVFTASRYVSNGAVPELTHLVYVDPTAYADLPERADLLAVGQAVGELNKVLPRRQFALIGPGRWGSRGDIKLGVRVTYADICNSAMLIEVARRRGNYVPDLSFGTHFFQDLVESEIQYLPLYPDDADVRFNEPFLTRSRNVLGELAPKYAHLEHVVHVIDVPESSSGRVLQVLLNADLDRALAHLVPPGSETERRVGAPTGGPQLPNADYWRWRLAMVERLASELDAETYGIRGVYLFGSVKNANAGPCSDIDLIVHMGDDPAQRVALSAWLDGWSRALGAVNEMRTGYPSTPLLDIHWVSDMDVERKSGFAAKIGAVSDAARRLTLGSDE